jgi:hypothetical protein
MVVIVGIWILLSMLMKIKWTVAPGLITMCGFTRPYNNQKSPFLGYHVGAASITNVTSLEVTFIVFVALLMETPDGIEFISLNDVLFTVKTDMGPLLGIPDALLPSAPAPDAVKRAATDIAEVTRITDTMATIIMTTDRDVLSDPLFFVSILSTISLPGFPGYNS